jgi:hypothetical protein
MDTRTEVMPRATAGSMSLVSESPTIRNSVTDDPPAARAASKNQLRELEPSKNISNKSLGLLAGDGRMLDRAESTD